MSENPMELSEEHRKRLQKKELYRSLGAPTSLQVLGGNAIAPMIGKLRPAFIAQKGDAQAEAVIGKLMHLGATDELMVHYWTDPMELTRWFVANGRDPNSCVAVLTGMWCSLREGTFALAGSKRGRAVTRSYASRGWVASMGFFESWHQAIYIAPKFTQSHGPLGMALQIGSWLR